MARNEEMNQLSIELDRLREVEDLILNALPKDGRSVGNKSLRTSLQSRDPKVNEEEFWEARDRLVASKKVGIGRGRGGSTFLIVTGTELPLEERMGQLQEDSKRPLVKKIKVENFKRISNAEIELGPITILVGGNNSGKSSFLQAIHTAVCCAQESSRIDKKVISEAELSYAPVHDFSLLGHSAPYETKSSRSRGRITFTPEQEKNQKFAAVLIELYKAQNHKSVGVEKKLINDGDQMLASIISDPESMFSVYVPGISGVAPREEVFSYAAISRRAARGDGNLVFRNILDRLTRDNKKANLEEILTQVFNEKVQIRIESEPDSKLHVDVLMKIGSEDNDTNFIPIELWGTGALQITQLVSYVLLFEPDILLIDEPDSHVHPSAQHRLMDALSKIANELECRVVITTHSRNILSAAPEESRIVWMKNGTAKPAAREDFVEILLDLGALDSYDPEAELIIFSEDQNPEMLQKAVESLPGDHSIAIASYNGVNNARLVGYLMTATAQLNHGPKIALHRDRDFMSDSELEKWADNEKIGEIPIFCPQLSDVESYYCSATHIVDVLGMALSEATALRNKILAENDEVFRRKFENKRKKANELYKSGGSPTNETLLPPDAPLPEEYIYGKEMLTKVSKELKKHGKRDAQTMLTNVASKELVKELEQFLNTQLGAKRK